MVRDLKSERWCHQRRESMFDPWVDGLEQESKSYKSLGRTAQHIIQFARWKRSQKSC